jgi:hypothetical protein
MAFALQAGRTTGCNYFAPYVAHFPNASAKTCYALPSRKANIVLPAFARSLPADENIFYFNILWGNLSKHGGLASVHESSIS